MPAKESVCWALGNGEIIFGADSGPGHSPACLAGFSLEANEHGILVNA